MYTVGSCSYIFYCLTRKADGVWIRMSADSASLQAQVESVLSALVKTATVELTRLFESRYRALAAAVDVGRTEVRKETRTTESLSAVVTKHSVGVQIDGDDDLLQEFGGFTLFSNHQRLDQCKEEEEEEEEEEKGCPIPIGLPLPEENGQVESVNLSSNTQNLADSTVVLEIKKSTDEETPTEVVLQVCMDTPVLSSTKKETPLVLLANNTDVTAGENVTFVCPLILKPETPGPKPECLTKPVEAEPPQACVSTAKGTAYSPSPSDGAMTPAPAGLWEKVLASKKPNGSLNMKLNPTSPDQKLLRPCAVPLVNILTIPDSHLKLEDNPKTGYLLPKELRRHQSYHTGHRLCCFDPCENGVWRLQSIVAHCRDGYTCSNCGKTFKHRKILRRHERFHTGEKPYQCVVCAKMFVLKKSLRRHQRFHTGERPHSCALCNKSFRLRDNLKAHMRFHSGEKPFSCATCGKTFRIGRNLEKHKLSQCGFFVPSFKIIAGR